MIWANFEVYQVLQNSCRKLKVICKGKFGQRSYRLKKYEECGI